MNEITKNTIELSDTLNLEDECNIEISKDNKYIVRIKKDDKLKYIGSKYSVERDIEKFINEINQFEVNETIIIFGLGAGEHIKYLVNNLSSTNKIFILEPNAEIVKETLKLNEVRILLEDDRIALCFLDNKIKKYINDFVDDYNISNTKIISFANYPSIFEKEYNYFLKQFEQIKISKKMVSDTFDTFSNDFFNNFMGNIFTLPNEEFYSINQLKNLYKGKPAVIVSAGPSLTKNVHLLKDVQDKFIIICGPRTIGTLIENNITPDFVCSVDPQDKIYTLMKDYIDLKVPLVFMDSSNSKIVKEQKGLKIIASNQGMEKYLENMLGIKVDSLMQGGSVAHFSMGLATYLGCNTVIFIGQDLAYTNDKFQADGTYAGEMDEMKYEYEKDKEKWNKDKMHNVYVKDIYGHTVRTSVILKSYIEEFEELIYTCPKIKFINSTEGGAHIDGSEVIPLKDTIDLYAVEVINKNLKDIVKESVIINEEDFTKRMFKIIEKLDIIKKACEDGIKYSDKMFNFYKYKKTCNLNRVFSELDRIDKVINNRECLDFLAYSMVSDINRVINNEYFKPRKEETEKELGMRLAERGLFIYLSVCQTVEDTIFKIKNEFICKNYGDEVEKDTRYRILEDTSLLFLHKPMKNIKNELWKSLYGDMEAKEEYMTVENTRTNTKNFGVINYSLVLLYEKPLNITKNKMLSVKVKREKNNNLYLRFIGEENLLVYKEIMDGSKIFDELINIDEKNFDLFLEEEAVGCVYRAGKSILYQEVFGMFYDEEIEITIDIENAYIGINNRMYKTNKYILHKIINNKYFTVCSFARNQDNVKYEIQSVNISGLN